MHPARRGLFFVLAAATAFAAAYLTRPLWCDEVLNLTEFAFGRTPLVIYRSYVIPNNHILYSVLLSGVTRLPDMGFGVELPLRLTSFGIALLTLTVFWCKFRARLGSAPLSLALLALVTAPAFTIYGTAVRGYILSALFVVLCMDAALNFAGRGSVRNGAWYFLWSLCAVATIPSNLFAVGAAALYALPLLGNDFYKKPRAYALAGLPFAALCLFYGPIWSSLLHCARLREGWSDAFAALGCVNAAMLTGFAMLLLVAVWGGGIAARRPCFRWIFSARALVLLLPLVPCMVLPVAPFPRTFFPYFFVAAAVGALGLKHLFACYCRKKHRWDERYLYCGLAAVVVGWGALFFFLPGCRIAMSARAGGPANDDLFAPYYTLSGFDPAGTVKLLKREGAEFPFYASFASDPHALRFYAILDGLPGEAVSFDNPRGPARERLGWIVLRRDEKPEALAHRWRVATDELRSRAEHGLHRIYRYAPRPEAAK